MKKLFSTLIICCTTIISIAQQSSNLVIFSEDGQPFYLMLNGIRQNAKPETNIKVDGLKQPYYSAKIIFEDKTLPILEKKSLQMTTVGSTEGMEVTYRIKKNQKNENVLRFYSETPLTQVIDDPKNITVVHYNTEPMPDITQVVVTQHTSTNYSNNNDQLNMNVGLGLGLPNINVNVNVNEPVVQHHQTTTVVTTNHSNSGTGIIPRPKINQPMSTNDFTAAKQTITKQKFDDTKLSTANQIISSNYLSAAQIKELMLLFSFEDTRLKLAKQAYSKCTDPNNYFIVNDAFTFSSSVEELNKAVK